MAEIALKEYLGISSRREFLYSIIAAQFSFYS